MKVEHLIIQGNQIQKYGSVKLKFLGIYLCDIYKTYEIRVLNLNSCIIEHKEISLKLIAIA